MKRFKSLALLSIFCLALFAETALAMEPFGERDVLPGYTFEIKIPAEGIENISASFEGENILFYKIMDTAEFDDPISRADFLELMFKNKEFEMPEADNIQNFPDVEEGSPHYEAIQKAAALGIINGYEDGLFRPDTTITRGQIAKILVEAFNPEANMELETVGFPDLPRNHVFYQHMNRAIQAEFFKGYPDGLMRPDREINVSEAEIVVQRAAAPEEFKDLGEREYFRAFVGVNRSITPGKKYLALDIQKTDGSFERKHIEVNVLTRYYATKVFSIPESTYGLFDDSLLDATWTLINEAKSTPEAVKLWEGKFIMPTTGRTTLEFGDKLKINGNYVGSHFGYDYANTEGTEIYAPNAGKVTLSSDTASYGYVIVIDHGQNVFTMYLHLSELIAEKGEYVEKGELIGLMGSTGLSAGSHLHFTQFVGGVVVDSDQWMEKEF